MARGSWRRKAKQEGLRSGFELRVRDFLDTKPNVKYGYEDRKIRYTIPATKHIYTPDFNMYTLAGEYVFSIETKGNFPPADRKKVLYVRDSNPDIDLRLVFQRDNPIRKGSKTHYSDWAEKNGFKYHVGIEIPYEWLFECRR